MKIFHRDTPPHKNKSIPEISTPTESTYTCLQCLALVGVDLRVLHGALNCDELAVHELVVRFVR